ncbi:hypothetical protein O181_052330 [Austropuccinia psidii MF-1]|uniref:Uncharacterized protein n=1 Tax=Austropuccinia psidii MF-1 TaxID=1389203 RepID=A0A9Q3E4Q4_9BASI|nr:hypothetical protein [Austropuccinia psidii MF-1]
MTSSLPPDHLTPLPCLLSCMNLLSHHLLIISVSSQDVSTPTTAPPQSPTLMLLHPAACHAYPHDMPLMLSPHVRPNPSLCFCSPTHHSHPPAMPSFYASDTTTPCLPPLLWLVGIHDEFNHRNMLSGLLCQHLWGKLVGIFTILWFVMASILAQAPSSQKPNFKSYEREKTVEPCAPTEEAGKDDVIFSGKVEIISKEQFVSKITQKIPRWEKIQKGSKIPDYVCNKITQEMTLLKMDLSCKGLGKRPNINSTKKPNKKCRTFEATKDSWDQGNEIINLEVRNNDNEPPQAETPCLTSEYLSIERKGEY